MTPVDYSKDTWEDVMRRAEGLRKTVLDGYREHGPCTTRQLARLLDLDILTVRPRTTELYQLGLVELVQDEDGTTGREGVYAAVPFLRFRQNFARLQREACDPQLTFTLDL
jgi:predicted transcriptional regulator